MDTMSYDEFERMPLFHEKGLFPRGKYLLTSRGKLDRVELNKVDYYYECIKHNSIVVMNVIADPVETNDGIPPINVKLEGYLPDFSDMVVRKFDLPKK